MFLVNMATRQKNQKEGTFSKLSVNKVKKSFNILETVTITALGSNI